MFLIERCKSGTYPSSPQHKRGDISINPKPSGGDVATCSCDAITAPSMHGAEKQGLPAMSQPKQQCKVLDLASLSTLELITLIDMFVCGWMCFVVPFSFLLFHFLEPEQHGCCQKVVRSGVFQGRSQILRRQATTSYKAGLVEQSLLYQKHHVLAWTTSFSKCPEPFLKGLASF